MLWAQLQVYKLYLSTLVSCIACVQLTERQYLWMAVGARAKARDYNNIEDKLLTVTVSIKIEVACGYFLLFKDSMYQVFIDKEHFK